MEILGPELNHRLGDSVQATWTEPPLWCRWLSPFGLGHRWGGRGRSTRTEPPLGVRWLSSPNWIDPPLWGQVVSSTYLDSYTDLGQVVQSIWTEPTLWSRWFSPLGQNHRLGVRVPVHLDRATAWGQVVQSTWIEPPLWGRWLSSSGLKHR